MYCRFLCYVYVLLFLIVLCCTRYLLFFFFFKQKTAYEMRISDWSSDVCSSDLHYLDGRPSDHPRFLEDGLYAKHLRRWLAHFDAEQIKIGRASCRERVFSTCRSRWSPYH